MRKTVKVDGHNLVKDLDTGAVINNDREEIRLAHERKKLRMKQKEEQELLKQDVAQLKNDMSEIKDLLRILADK